MNFKIYFFLFLIYSIMGWCMEVILGLIQNKKFVDRGFLIGPYCPIYGAGSILITSFLQGYVDHISALFCMAIVICGLLEYFTSYVMEKVFKARWWDYSQKKYNINGRVCLETIIPFGLLSCMIIYITNPFFINIFYKIPENYQRAIFIICLSLFVVDCFISFIIISRLRSTVKNVNKIEDNTEEITKQVKSILTSKSFLDRRLINAFPKISIKQVKQRIIEKTEQVKENVSKAREEAAEYIRESANKVKETTIKVKEEAVEHIKESSKKVRANTARVKEEVTQHIKTSESDKNTSKKSKNKK